MTQRITRLLEIRFRIAAQIYLGIGGAVMLTLAASLVGWVSFNQMAAAQSRVIEGSVPELAAAFGVAQYSGSLVAASDSLVVAATPEDVDGVNALITEDFEALTAELSLLESRGGEEARYARISSHSNTLIANIGGVEGSIAERFRLAQRNAELREELDSLRSQLAEIITPAIDDQLFYTATGYRELGEPAAPASVHLSEEELIRVRYLLELQSEANIAAQLLATAGTVSEASLIEPLRERFESSAGRIERNLFALEGTPQHAELAPIFARLLELGFGTRNGFDLSAQNLQLLERQQELLVSNRDIAVLLVDEVDGLVSSAQQGADSATAASTQAILAGRTLLLVITVVSVAGAAIIAWLYVGRVLLRRLGLLSGWMRSMAGGDLETPVAMEGRDEVADMASALEMFRISALEAQRLNLVEQLAEELQEKNGALEQALDDLNAAQDRIVVQQKLAALGELTAGVAHEIRNPLNFVKNFSESSRELLEEMKETLEESEDGELDDEQKELLQDIFGDLSENMERILSHGDRANRIVEGMLMMGRESVNQQPTNINNLLDEHARLAYHSARAQDSNFQLDMQYDLDPEIGEIQANPQDLGRVFLNMMSNACYATDERRRDLVEAGGADGYMPTLYVSSQRSEDDIVVRIRDNGMGMPPEVVEKIFNPFFTTKPTDKGTGLGLSISSDIVRQHGGTIEVSSAPGEFTEMCITLPLVTAMSDGQSGDD